jgi:hypothetical protein
MSIIPLLMFCSLLLVAGSIVMFVWSSRQGDCHHSDRLCLLPLEDDDARPAPPGPAASPDSDGPPAPSSPPVPATPATPSARPRGSTS